MTPVPYVVRALLLNDQTGTIECERRERLCEIRGSADAPEVSSSGSFCTSASEATGEDEKEGQQRMQHFARPTYTVKAIIRCINNSYFVLNDVLSSFFLVAVFTSF